MYHGHTTQIAVRPGRMQIPQLHRWGPWAPWDSCAGGSTLFRDRKIDISTISNWIYLFMSTLVCYKLFNLSGCRWISKTQGVEFVKYTQRQRLMYLPNVMRRKGTRLPMIWHLSVEEQRVRKAEKTFLCYMATSKTWTYFDQSLYGARSHTTDQGRPYCWIRRRSNEWLGQYLCQNLTCCLFFQLYCISVFHTLSLEPLPFCFLSLPLDTSSVEPALCIKHKLCCFFLLI